MVSGCLYSIGVGPGDAGIDDIKSGSYQQQMSCFGFAGGEPPKVCGLSDRKTDFAGNR